MLSMVRGTGTDMAGEWIPKPPPGVPDPLSCLECMVGSSQGGVQVARR